MPTDLPHIDLPEDLPRDLRAKIEAHLADPTTEGGFSALIEDALRVYFEQLEWLKRGYPPPLSVQTATRKRRRSDDAPFDHDRLIAENHPR